MKLKMKMKAVNIQVAWMTMYNEISPAMYKMKIITSRNLYSIKETLITSRPMNSHYSIDSHWSK